MVLIMSLNSLLLRSLHSLLLAQIFSHFILVLNICASETITAFPAQGEIIIDGHPTEKSWALAESVTTHDDIAEIDIRLKALYDKNNIYLLVQFPDSTESRVHKSWVWDKKMELYSTGWDREDIFVIKWFLEIDYNNPKGFSIYGNSPHRADIWYWKANRTDPLGFADDKVQILSSQKSKRATVIMGEGGPLYLLRKGDAGSAAYATTLAVNYKGDKLQRFSNTPPTGSRADVRAKGEWKEGEWTIEFKRALDTFNSDDISFSLKDSYVFGVSRYEVAGRSMDQRAEQPLYGAGDLSHLIRLQFSPDGLAVQE